MQEFKAVNGKVTVVNAVELGVPTGIRTPVCAVRGRRTKILKNGFIKLSWGWPRASTRINHEPKSGILPPRLAKLGERLREFKHDYHQPVVYFLVRNNRVIYVGQTVNLAQRMSDHVTTKAFDRAFYVLVPESDLDIAEASFIRLLNPPENKSKPRRLFVWAKSYLKEKFNIDFSMHKKEFGYGRS